MGRKLQIEISGSKWGCGVCQYVFQPSAKKARCMIFKKGLKVKSFGSVKTNFHRRQECLDAQLLNIR